MVTSVPGWSACLCMLVWNRCADVCLMSQPVLTIRVHALHTWIFNHFCDLCLFSVYTQMNWRRNGPALAEHQCSVWVCRVCSVSYAPALGVREACVQMSHLFSLEWVASSGTLSLIMWREGRHLTYAERALMSTLYSYTSALAHKSVAKIGF